jgi:hypothetical protein
MTNIISFIIKLQDFQARIKLERAVVQKEFEERGFFIWIGNKTNVIIAGVLTLTFFISSEILCGVLVYFIMSTLKNSLESLTNTTYKLHRSNMLLG